MAYPDLSGIKLLEGGWDFWTDSRFSHAQRQRIPLSGWVGELVVEGEVLRSLGPLLHALNVVGVGKGAVLGLGYIEASPIG